MRKNLFALILTLCFLLSAALPVSAAETEEPETSTLSISTLERFLSFAEKCRLDSYSENLVVTLQTDLDLSGVDFTGIPTFSGTFDGGSHTISGLSITAEGSTQGLFRYLTDTAVVKNLTVRGTVQPEGSRCQVGGIAGSNAGRITNCIFVGTVSGADTIGALAGINTLSGIIENCRVEGAVHGDHFIGGAAGENSGVIRSCTNYAEVNTTAQQNEVALSDITMDTLTSTEAVNSVTDVGGIAGTSSGVIRDCVNWANIGYQHMGYNVGGIAGTQSGYIYGCENRGEILGRKEVGGIVGQMEPAALVEYEEDALQILQRQLNSMGSVVSKTASNVQKTGDALVGQVWDLQEHVWDAEDAVGLLIPDKNNPELPDSDTLQAAKNGLSSSLSGMTQSLDGMSATTQSAMGTLSNNLYALQDQINAMRTTLGNISETMGGSISDVSDKDTELDLTGKVQSCYNYGKVLADRHVGGIAGAMAMENDLDAEEDWTIEGENSLNFESELRAVILDCENSGTVTASKQMAGGIVGLQSLGLVKNGRNTGDLEAAGTEYVGGISGQSTGYIRASSAKCTISGGSYVGGIAGSATVATDCRSMVEITDATERSGAILGLSEEGNDEEETPIANNLYMTVSTDFGGIDGLSYAGLAEPVTMGDFLSLEDLPALFRSVTIKFCYDDGTERRFTVPIGGNFDLSNVPAIPEKSGYIGEWEGLENTSLSGLIFNLSFDALYIRHNATLQTETARENGLPVLLVQGDFTPYCTVNIAENAGLHPTETGEIVLESWEFTVSEPEALSTARLNLPDGCDTDNLRVYVQDTAGTWRIAEHSVDGSYAVFALNADDTAISLTQTQSASPFLPAITIASAAIALLLLLLMVKKRKKM